MLGFTQMPALDVRGFDFAGSFTSGLLRLAIGFSSELRAELHRLR